MSAHSSDDDIRYQQQRYGKRQAEVGRKREQQLHPTTQQQHIELHDTTLTEEQEDYIYARLCAHPELGYDEVPWLAKEFGVDESEVQRVVNNVLGNLRRLSTDTDDDQYSCTMSRVTTVDGPTDITTTIDKTKPNQTTYTTTIWNPAVSAPGSEMSEVTDLTDVTGQHQSHFRGREAPQPDRHAWS